MSAVNVTKSSPSALLLMGIPGADVLGHIWISVLLFILSLLSIFGNGSILYIIKTDHHLREPMYLFLSMLALTDLGLTFSTLPTVISVFWFNTRDIPFDVCMIQMFFFHSFCSMDSTVLFLMACDRFIAICYPLQYSAILSNPTILKIGVMAVIRSTSIHVPEPILLKRLQFCHNNVLSHSFCFHPDVIKLACSDTTVNSTYGLVLVLSTILLDCVIIILSYIMILRTVLNINSLERRFKAINTCVSHVCVVLIAYIPLVGLTIIYRFGKNAPPLIHFVMGIIYVFLPPALNPIIYSLKNKLIREALYKLVYGNGDLS